MSNYRKSGDRFVSNPNRGYGETASARFQARADFGGTGLPADTTMRAFAKPTSMPASAGLISESQTELIRLARDMLDNDAISGAVAQTIADSLFGNFALGNMPDKEHLKPYTTSLDRVRIKSLMPALALSYLVDGAFLGTGVFDSTKKVYSSIMNQDLMNATVYPVPFFGATPVIDVAIHPEVQRMMVGVTGDPRFAEYREFLPKEFLTGGLVKLQPENTFYVPRRGLAHNPLGVSLFRRAMVIYLLEKSLSRGTLEMSYRRQRPILHVVAGDENWDPSQEEMRTLSDLFLAADLDPLGAVITTRVGVQPQEIGGTSDMWKWTDNVDVLTSMKLKGLGMPDGLLGGDMSLDSVSATLTVFIKQLRSLRDYLTRAFFYEKFFPYIAVTNNHRRDIIAPFEERGSFRRTSQFAPFYERADGVGFNYTDRYVERANDADVDLGDYITPYVMWHEGMRPEGDKEYLDLLMSLSQAGVPIPVRMIAAAGGQDIDDLLNGAPDDLAQREKVSQIMQAIKEMSGEDQGGSDEYATLSRALGVKPGKPLSKREFDDYLHPRTNINGHAYVTTARERKRVGEKMNRMIARAQSELAPRLNAKRVHRVPFTSKSSDPFHTEVARKKYAY